MTQLRRKYIMGKSMKNKKIKATIFIYTSFCGLVFAVLDIGGRGEQLRGDQSTQFHREVVFWEQFTFLRGPEGLKKQKKQFLDSSAKRENFDIFDK